MIEKTNKKTKFKVFRTKILFLTYDIKVILKAYQI